MVEIFYYTKAGEKIIVEDIVLPDDPEKVKSLEAKVAEYKARLVSPTSRIDILPNTYRFQILSRLVAKKKVNAPSMYKEASKQENFNNESYIECLCIIDDYCRTGGMNMYRGTGLPGHGN